MRSNRLILLACAAPSAALLLLACSGGGGGTPSSAWSTPTAPASQSVPQLATADVAIDGVSVVGETIESGSGTSTLFTATLGSTSDATHVDWMGMQYPNFSHAGMHGTYSTTMLYDDGTHGDRFAHDGVYSYEDHGGGIGPHAAGCPAGEYRYTFEGLATDGRAMNQLQRVVTVR